MECIRFKEVLLICHFIFFNAVIVFSQVWKQKPLHKFTVQQYEMTLDYWKEKYKDHLEVERITSTTEGTGVFLLKITDKKVSDENKQIALISALHGGPEESGSTGVLALTEWLLGNSKEAIETRRKQVLLILPIMNPYGFFVKQKFGNSKNMEPYTSGGLNNWDLATMTFKKPLEAPEIMAFLNVVDKYHPEVHLDLHGTGGRSYPGQMMFEVTGSAYSNYLLRPWDWRLTEAMVRAGNEAGYPSDRGEADAQQLKFGPGMNKLSSQLWRGRAQFYTAQYGYIKYHTLIGALEVGWEESAVVRTRGLLRIGNRVWNDEKYPGYPVNRLKPFIGRYLTAYGNSAAKLRVSRVELWQKQGAYSVGVLYPQTEGRETFIVGFTEKGIRKINSNLESFIDSLRTDTAIDANEVEKFIKAGPEQKLAYELPGQDTFKLQSGPVQHGFGMRLRLQYKDAKITCIRLNGHVLKQSSSDGYEVWPADGFLQVQVNVPPFKSAQMDLAFLTCEFSTKTKRTYGWMPPAAVLKKMTSDTNLLQNK